MTAIGIGDETSSGITQGTIESVGDETAEGSAIGRTLIVNDGFSKTLEHVFDDGAGVGINGAAPRRDSTCSRVGSHGHRRAGRSGAGNGVSCRVWTDGLLDLGHPISPIHCRYSHRSIRAGACSPSASSPSSADAWLGLGWNCIEAIRVLEEEPYSVGDAGDEEGIGAQNEGVGVEEGIQEGAVGENESVGRPAGSCPAGTEAVEGEEVGDVTGVFWGDYVDWGENNVKTLRSLMRERRKKRKQEQQNKKGEGSSRANEQWFSDCEDEELKSVRGSDDEGDGCTVWDERMDMGKVDLAVGMKFETRAKFRDVMRDWAVRRGWDLKLVKNEKHLILATCKNEFENKQANYKYIGKRLESFVRDNPNESLQSLKNKVRRELQIEVSDYKVYRAKKYALELIRGDVKEQYARLYDYCHTVVKHNPASSLIMKLNKEVNPPVLQRMYFCLKGMRDGFIEGCRPLIGLDGCFLKGLFKGQLLAAIGRDPNDNIYPIAVAYVEVEKYDSWEWFLNLLLRDIGSHNERGWAFISDRQKGLLEAIAELAPGAEHRFCLRHMYNNFKGKFKGQELKKMFWKAASTYNVNQHLKTMAEIQNMYPKRVGEQTPYEWLAEIPPVHWARCFFPTKTRCDVLE
ncbi:UNVERIFIED_CONTAM: hypothetical protein Sangu_3157000 [Sesamum angustifolium]|uniref:MULE transposase domain-containing protein n=1 Tax=Sesamum angustifolium TaxID=2727405 RepID=A0AAW2JU91_9LAMI